MNLRFVEAFYWVASLKSVTRAADKLFLTQSAMSSRISALEEELGVLLLDRRDRQFKLTVAGQRFFTYAQKLLELQREVKAEMGSATPQSVLMRIGAIESVLHSWLIPWIEKLRLEHPALELELTVETTPILMDQVRRGTQDLVFAAMPAPATAPKIRPTSSNRHEMKRDGTCWKDLRGGLCFSIGSRGVRRLRHLGCAARASAYPAGRLDPPHQRAGR